MDSMRSLNTSLPAAYSSRPAPPEQLLQAFKTAALSVTNLYKSAAADQQSSRAAGYQDALDDLLRMMDSENLGLQDGEGWRIRQWVTERYDHSANAASSDLEDNRTAATDTGREDTADEEVTADSRLQDASSDTDIVVPTSGNGQQQPAQQPAQQQQHQQQHQQHHHHHQQQQQQPPQSQRSDSAPPVFKFSAGSSAAVDSDDMQVNDDTRRSPEDGVDASSLPPAPPSPIQVQLVNRANRTTLRNTSQRHGRAVARTPASTAGAKRKLNQLHQVPDFFNIPNFNFRDDPDHGGSGKRSRLV